MLAEATTCHQLISLPFYQFSSPKALPMVASSAIFTSLPDLMSRETQTCLLLRWMRPFQAQINFHEYQCLQTYLQTGKNVSYSGL